MRMRRLVAISLLVGLVVVQPLHARAQLKDLLKSIGETLRGRELSESTIIQGLKEALQIGTGNAVEMVSQVDGYFENPQIRIPLPESVQNVEKILRAVGFGPKVDAFELSMNRASSSRRLGR
jgi:hypothetical protein